MYTSLFCVIIPTLFPYFLPFWYPYILLHFKYVLYVSEMRLFSNDMSWIGSVLQFEL